MNAEMASTIDPIGLKPTSTSSMVVIYDVQNGDKRPANLVRSFGELYSVARLETLDDLDTIDELVDADELKNKLLFSVVVVSLKVYITLEYISHSTIIHCRLSMKLSGKKFALVYTIDLCLHP